MTADDVEAIRAEVERVLSRLTVLPHAIVNYDNFAIAADVLAAVSTTHASSGPRQTTNEGNCDTRRTLGVCCQFALLMRVPLTERPRYSVSPYTQPITGSTSTSLSVRHGTPGPTAGGGSTVRPERMIFLATNIGNGGRRRFIEVHSVER